MKILIGCEFSGRVRDAFIKLDEGHDVVSCDFLPSDISGPHIQGDVIKAIHSEKWDMGIFFPPCKYICVGGNNWLNRRPDLKWRENRELASEFFMSLVNSPIEKIAIENPIGVMSTLYRKPDYIERPYNHGHRYNKDICLWLKNLPKLKPTCFVSGPYRKIDFWSSERHKDGRDVKAITFCGVARAMANQWGFESLRSTSTQEQQR